MKTLRATLVLLEKCRLHAPCVGSLTVRQRPSFELGVAIASILKHSFLAVLDQIIIAPGEVIPGSQIKLFSRELTIQCWKILVSREQCHPLLRCRIPTYQQTLLVASDCITRLAGYAISHLPARSHCQRVFASERRELQIIPGGGSGLHRSSDLVRSTFACPVILLVLLAMGVFILLNVLHVAWPLIRFLLSWLLDRLLGFLIVRLQLAKIPLHERVDLFLWLWNGCKLFAEALSICTAKNVLSSVQVHQHVETLSILTLRNRDLRRLDVECNLDSGALNPHSARRANNTALAHRESCSLRKRSGMTITWKLWCDRTWLLPLILRLESFRCHETASTRFPARAIHMGFSTGAGPVNHLTLLDRLRAVRAVGNDITHSENLMAHLGGRISCHVWIRLLPERTFLIGAFLLWAGTLVRPLDLIVSHLSDPLRHGVRSEMLTNLLKNLFRRAPFEVLEQHFFVHVRDLNGSVLASDALNA